MFAWSAGWGGTQGHTQALRAGCCVPAPRGAHPGPPSPPLAPRAACPLTSGPRWACGPAGALECFHRKAGGRCGAVTGLDRPAAETGIGGLWEEQLLSSVEPPPIRVQRPQPTAGSRTARRPFPEPQRPGPRKVSLPQPPSGPGVFSAGTGLRPVCLCFPGPKQASKVTKGSPEPANCCHPRPGPTDITPHCPYQRVGVCSPFPGPHPLLHPESLPLAHGRCSRPSSHPGPHTLLGPAQLPHPWEPHPPVLWKPRGSPPMTQPAQGSSRPAPHSACIKDAGGSLGR